MENLNKFEKNQQKKKLGKLLNRDDNSISVILKVFFLQKNQSKFNEEKKTE